MKPAILIVDDNKTIRRMIMTRLTRLGYDVEVAENGIQALDALKFKHIDLVLLDQQMPDMDGITTLGEIRKKFNVCLPVIMITASSSLNLAIMFMKSGGTDFVEKPIDFDILHVKILRAIKTAERLQNEIAERQKAEETLRQSNLELQASNEELDAFAHTVAHDLQTPLSHMIGFAGILTEYHDTMPPAEQEDLFQVVVRSGYKMSSIVNNLLLLSSVRKETEIQMQSLDMAVILDETLHRLTPLIEEHQVKIDLPNESTWPIAQGYAPWVEQVWINYLSNAIKYGGAPPRITIGVTSDGKVNNKARFWVQDNGQGLSITDQSHLFTPYTRLNQVQVKGHGLGLSIVQRIIKQLGGEVGVESKVGQGSLFYFTLPVEA